MTPPTAASISSAPPSFGTWPVAKRQPFGLQPVLTVNHIPSLTGPLRHQDFAEHPNRVAKLVVEVISDQEALIGMFVALGFDVRDSDLPLRIAWPLLLLNSVNFFTEAKDSVTGEPRGGTEIWLGSS